MKWTYALQFLTHLELCLNGYSPLHFAAYYDCLEVVEFITLCTENVNIKDNLGDTPLHLAAGNGQINVVLSLANKVDNLNGMNNDGDTPLHLAAFNGHAKIVEFLVSKVDNPNPIDNVGLSPYEFAVMEEKFEVVEILHPYNNYWPTTPLQLPFLGSVEFRSIMQLPILLILKCIWRNWKKSSSAKQFWDSIGTDTIRAGFIFSCFLIFCEAIYLVRHSKEMVYLILICFQAVDD